MGPAAPEYCCPQENKGKVVRQRWQRELLWKPSAVLLSAAAIGFIYSACKPANTDQRETVLATVGTTSTQTLAEPLGGQTWKAGRCPAAPSAPAGPLTLS